MRVHRLCLGGDEDAAFDSVWSNAIDFHFFFSIAMAESCGRRLSDLQAVAGITVSASKAGSGCRDGGAACDGARHGTNQSEGETAMSIKDVLRKHEDFLMALPDVQAVGLGRKGGKDVITVFVATTVQRQDIPSSLEGYDIDIQEIGTVTAQGGKPK